ncbi:MULTISPECIES: hypothetical protein [Gimesia]|uniref:Uncharacterized protein n=2 Tax=Gimesia TaxID=1649453 RepID=A0A6I6AHL9_9PLAN|nr:MULTISPECIES: hypothetical protein [Gimesia]MAC55594.1 hypothetical protein [Gimesia sp.]MBP69236.1 hypothetical protein [Haliea sp.]QGQ26183.1 hypothetical protein F1728_27415 [Gimesia benthica]|tara:strand:- start:6969 stop:7649 length:681 start_codon:yes stop_codon:yes gene_type:complete
MITGGAEHWDDFFEQSLIPQVFDYVINSWEQVPVPEPGELEDVVSDQLYTQMLKSKQRNHFPFLISREDLEFDLELAKESGRKDIVFYPSLQEQDIYMCLEAKRLNAIVSGKKRSCASEYVKDGLQRFVDGKYAKCVRHAAMLGYVLDGDVSNAMGNVEKNILSRTSELGMLEGSGFLDSTIRVTDSFAKETHHARKKNNGEKIRVHHLFLECQHHVAGCKGIADQ